MTSRTPSKRKAEEEAEPGAAPAPAPPPEERAAPGGAAEEQQLPSLYKLVPKNTQSSANSRPNRGKNNNLLQPLTKTMK